MKPDHTEIERLRREVQKAGADNNNT